MNETTKNKEKRDEDKPEEVKKPDRVGQTKRIDFTKDPVVFDKIRKETNDRERKLEKIRAEKYDYLRGEYFKKILEEECRHAGIPIDTFEAKVREDSRTKPPICREPSPMPVPKTSSATIGWRSSKREYNLELVGPFYVSPKHTIEPTLLPGEFRVEKQKFIFLG